MKNILIKLAFWASFAYTFLSLLFYSLPFEFLWRASFLNIYYLKMSPPFADFRWISATSQCGVPLIDLVRRVSPGCDIYGRNGGGLGYPPQSVEIARLLKLTISSTQITSFCFGLALILIFLTLLHSIYGSSKSFYILATILLSSFPLQLAIERGNLDIIVFILIVSASALISLKSKLFSLLSALFTYTAVAVKAYPLFGFLFFAVCSGNHLSRFRSLLLVTSSIVGLLSVIPWYLLSSSDIPSAAWRVISHGFLIQDSASSPLLILEQIASALILIIGLYLGYALRLRYTFIHLYLEHLSSFKDRFIFSLTSISGFSWLACYFISDGYDYRIIFFFPCLIFLFYYALSPTGRSSLLSNILSKFILISIVLTSLGYYSWMAPSRLIGFNLVQVLSVVIDSLCLPLLASLSITFLLPTFPSIASRKLLISRHI